MWLGGVGSRNGGRCVDGIAVGQLWCVMGGMDPSGGRCLTRVGQFSGTSGWMGAVLSLNGGATGSGVLFVLWLGFWRGNQGNGWVSGGKWVREVSGGGGGGKRPSGRWHPGGMLVLLGCRGAAFLGGTADLVPPCSFGLEVAVGDCESFFVLLISRALFVFLAWLTMLACFSLIVTCRLSLSLWSNLVRWLTTRSICSLVASTSRLVSETRDLQCSNTRSLARALASSCRFLMEDSRADLW